MNGDQVLDVVFIKFDENLHLEEQCDCLGPVLLVTDDSFGFKSKQVADGFWCVFADTTHWNKLFFSPMSKVKQPLLEKQVWRYRGFSTQEGAKQPEMYTRANFSMKQWDPGIQKFTLLDASVIWRYFTMVLVFELGDISTFLQFMQVFNLHIAYPAVLKTQLAYTMLSISDSVWLRFRAFLVTIRLILMESKIISQDDQKGIMSAIFDKTTSSLHTSMSIQIVQWSKGLIVAVLQMISTSDQTHLLTYLR
jgi:hypothetical protein